MAGLTISIYVANLSQYKQGTTIGDWFELPVSWSNIEHRCQLNGVEEEYIILDYEAPFEISENENIDRLNRVAELFEEYASNEAMKYIPYLVNEMGVFETFEIAVEQIDDIHVYPDCKNFGDYAYVVFEEMGAVQGLPEIVRNNIDWDSVGYDIQASDGNIYQVDDVVIEVP
ncbi:hypothetical protein GCM10025886_14080 [Tetragenococcus halophilus subsp. flandriensis]|uniref:antirestriction protein ArdA n=1 Tax=Tetragenococcus halophilus TaxID=51669 RepID=UPI0023E963DF|nr:antirestriction protein ArdA [Tetragenococcus halophilus]GMA08257.1 hypothetical protein GCM10025886_14080 [Tetragenococcus halophilus subsp. flandriensis]